MTRRETEEVRAAAILLVSSIVREVNRGPSNRTQPFVDRLIITATRVAEYAGDRSFHGAMQETLLVLDTLLAIAFESDLLARAARKEITARFKAVQS